jgi:RNA polymerase sigma-70 factor (ECF subfamily)
VKDDAQLIDETLAGDSGAFGQLVEKHQDRLYTSVVHVLGSAEDARDVVQDAFVQAFVKLESFKRKSAFFTWLYRIAFNLAISHQRRQRPTVSIDRTREASGSEPIDGGLGPDDCLEQQDRAVQVRVAMAALSDEHRTILVLREIEDSSYDTMAEILDLPVGTIRSRLHRARLALRDELEKIMQEELG